MALGARWFMQNLIDGDPASNSGGWQWCAGTGTDAAPYFRIFNPYLQSKRFDAQGEYIRHWLPELTALPNELIHDPEQIQSALSGKYPPPVIDHGVARQRALDFYHQA